MINDGPIVFGHVDLNVGNGYDQYTGEILTSFPSCNAPLLRVSFQDGLSK